MTRLPFYLAAGYTASFQNHTDIASHLTPGQVTRTPNNTERNPRAPRIIIIIIIIIIRTMNSNNRIAKTMYSLGAQFVSGI